MLWMGIWWVHPYADTSEGEWWIFGKYGPWLSLSDVVDDDTTVVDDNDESDESESESDDDDDDEEG